MALGQNEVILGRHHVDDAGISAHRAPRDCRPDDRCGSRSASRRSRRRARRARRGSSSRLARRPHLARRSHRIPRSRWISMAGFSHADASGGSERSGCGRRSSCTMRLPVETRHVMRRIAAARGADECRVKIDRPPRQHRGARELLKRRHRAEREQSRRAAPFLMQLPAGSARPRRAREQPPWRARPGSESMRA